AAFSSGLVPLAWGLFQLNKVVYVALWALTAVRLIAFRPAVVEDLTHRRERVRRRGGERGVGHAGVAGRVGDRGRARSGRAGAGVRPAAVPLIEAALARSPMRRRGG
ncbi:MAG TPA: hypothetical protein VJT32_17410, partial [bacterium]|nr:hypothetical protein [bacterium]